MLIGSSYTILKIISSSDSILKIISLLPANKPSSNMNSTETKSKKKQENGGFKTAEDGRLIISDKFIKDSDESEDDDEDAPQDNKKVKRGMEDDSSGGKFLRHVQKKFFTNLF